MTPDARGPVNGDAPRPPGRREWILAAALLAALTAGLHYDVVFQGRSLVLTNLFNPMDYRPLPANYGPEMVPPGEWHQRNLVPYGSVQDAGSAWWQWEPALLFLRSAIQLREFPFWDPYIGGGTPAMANLTPAFFFPPFVLLAAAGASVGLKNVYLLLLVWQGAFFFYLFLRAAGLRMTSAVMGGAVLILTGAVTQGTGTHMGQAALCLPVCLWVTRHFLVRPSPGRSALMAAVYASAALASFPPVLVGVFGFTALYALCTVVFDPAVEKRRASAIRWGVVTTMSIGLVAVYYLPALYARAAATHAVANYSDGARMVLPVNRIFQLLSPTLMGGVPAYEVTLTRLFGGAYLHYLGAAALLLALLATPGQGSRRAMFYAASAMTVASLLKVFGLPPVQWIAYVPLFSDLHFAFYLGFALVMALACLTAIGVDNAISGRVSRRHLFWAAAVAATLVAGVVPAVGVDHIMASPGRRFWWRDWSVAAGSVIAGIAVLAIGTRRWPAHRLVPAALAVILVGEGAYNAARPAPRAWDVFASPPHYVGVLRDVAAGDRVLTFGGLPANVNSAYEIFLWDSLMAFNSPRLFELHHRYAGSRDPLFPREARAVPPEPVLDRANTGAVLVREAFPTVVHTAVARGYREVYSDDYVRIFRRPTPPRFFFSSAYDIVTPATALDAVATTDARTLLLEAAPGVARQPNDGADVPVRIESYRRNRIRVHVDAPREGLVYASETFFTGWTVTVNGEPAPLLHANYAFRAVPVGAGRSVITFTHRPEGLRTGAAISALSLLGLGLAMLRFRVAGAAARSEA